MPNKKWIKYDEIENWSEVRTYGIGGSDAAAVLGFNPYFTPYQVWTEKVTHVPNPFESERTKIGKAIEHFIAGLYSAETGNKVMQDNKIRIHPEFDFLRVNIDRMIASKNGNGPGLLEIKNVDKDVFRDWNNEIPLYYYPQLTHGLAVTGWNWGELVCLVGGNHLEILPFTRDETWLRSQTKFLVEWWNNHVVNKIEPEKKLSDFAVSKAVSGSIVADDQLFRDFQLLTAINNEYSDLKKKKEELSNKIKLQIGDNEALFYREELIATWKAYSNSKFNEKLFKEENPELYKKYLEETTSRKFYPKYKALEKIQKKQKELAEVSNGK